MSRCMCGAYDCGACYPTTYKQYIALENGEIEEGEEYQEPEEDEDVVRSERSERDERQKTTRVNDDLASRVWAR